MPNTKPFQLLIKPVGADCNLCCDYCFYLRTHELYPMAQRHLMDDVVLETMIKGMMEQRFSESVFAWQGGEPTLAGVDFFRKVVQWQQIHGVTGQTVGNAIQTNGILLDDSWCRLFSEYRFLVGLSLDGPEEVHNTYRRDRAGHGSWAKAIAAARLMERWQVQFNILCVVNNNNVSLGADLLRWFVGQGFNYVQFISCMEPESPYNVDPETYGEFLCATFDYWYAELGDKVSVRDFDVITALRLGAHGCLCTYGRTCDQYIVIEHTGDVYPCDFFVKKEWKLGNVLEHPLPEFLQNEKYKAFAYQKDKVPACRGCSWRSLCHGGCQKDRLAGGSVVNATPFCSAYRLFFEHALPQIDAWARRYRNKG